MHIQVNTGHNIDNNEALTTWISDVVESALERHSDRITRVEVHLRDESAGKGGQDDKHCTMEARLEGHQPLVATDQAATVDLAVTSAAEKLVRLIGNTLGKLRDQDPRRTETLPVDETPVSEA